MHPAAVIKSRPMDDRSTGEGVYFNGTAKIAQLHVRVMFVLPFFPACIVSVSPRGTFEKHEKRIQMDDLVCSLDMCHVRQSVFEQSHCLHAKDYFKSCQESWETRILKIITRTIVLNRAVPQGSLLMWKELLLAKVVPVNKCVSVICRILRTTPPMTLYTILPF